MLLGGVDVRDVPLAELRRAVAIVTQKPVLFSVPLRDNLLAARPDADWSEVLDACEAAGVAGFVDDLPDGYDTLIGERGVEPLRAASGSVSRSRARSSRARACSSSTTRCRRSTPRRSAIWSRICARRSPGARCSSPASGSRRCSSPTARSSCSDGRIVEEGLPEDLIRAGGPFAELFGEEALAA